jgi:hypothetical protein
MDNFGASKERVVKKSLAVTADRLLRLFHIRVSNDWAFRLHGFRLARYTVAETAG